MAEPAPFAALRPTDPVRLGSYRLIGRLGSGGMGTVYAAEDQAGRTVAVKVVNADLADDERFAHHFRREVNAARRVRPFCTAPVLDARLEERPLFVVTEYVEGPTLQDLVIRQGPLAGAALEQLAVGVTAALTAIHGARVLHRDLKPANVLLSPVGPRVIDFGIARTMDGPGGSVQPTQLAGTPGYMAPEVLRGGPATQAADVFAWGCVIAYAASGAHPFAGDGMYEIHHRVLTEPPRLDGLDGALLGLVQRALDKDPARRGTAAALLAELVGEETADAGRATEVLEQVWRVPATWVATEPAAAHAQAEPPAPAPRSRPGRRTVLGGAVAAALVAAVAAYVLWPEGGGGATERGQEQRVRSGPVILGSISSFELDTQPPTGAQRWIDTRDLTDDLRLETHQGLAPDIVSGKPNVLVRWSGEAAPTEQQCAEALGRSPVSRFDKVKRGDRFCLQTSEGRTAHVRLVSLPVGEGQSRAEVTVWELPG
ncbi:serine/threonine-protein kinase [Kitasatospora sp. NPDC096147]|uniref:serine/threonine-protein kinase n=1 Tax=Kitasatospora sp. NPDC096147 TaxID=3364093 RepID=UPI003829EEAD